MSWHVFVSILQHNLLLTINSNAHDFTSWFLFVSLIFLASLSYALLILLNFSVKFCFCCFLLFMSFFFYSTNYLFLCFQALCTLFFLFSSEASITLIWDLYNIILGIMHSFLSTAVFAFHKFLNIILCIFIHLHISSIFNCYLSCEILVLGKYCLGSIYFCIVHFFAAIHHLSAFWGYFYLLCIMLILLSIMKVFFSLLAHVLF